MKKTRIILFLSIMTAVSACQKYLGVIPKGIIIPEQIKHYEDMLYSPTMTKTFPFDLLGFTDDNLNVFDAINQSPAANGYFWKPVITINEKASPEVWGPLYRVIYDANVIISGVPQATDGTDAKKQQTKAEALTIRANSYLDLLTVFAKAYNPATAATDPGLPLVTSIDVRDKVPGRSTLKATIDTLIDNLSTAAKVLPATNTNRYRVTKFTAYGLLSRIYLYMGDFANAEIYTDSTLKSPNSSILDYTPFASYSAAPIYELNPEVIWQRSGTAPDFSLYTDDLKTYFNTNDKRYTLLTLTNNNGLGRSSFKGQYNYGISFPEMSLTKAELLARKGKFTEAMAMVNALRKKRILPSAYTDQTAATGEEALRKVLAERRRELAYSGLRWFDMKRLDAEGRMPEVKRISKITGQVEATLAPHSPNYVFEIPVRVQMFNPGMQLNH